MTAPAYAVQVVVDASEPHALADWWAQTLGWAVEPSDEAVIRSMVEQGRAVESDTTTHRGALVWRAGAAIVSEGTDQHLRVLFQHVPEAKAVKDRIHLDVRVGDDDVDAVVRSLTERGARVLHEGRQGPSTWTTMQDPEGNEFCVSH
jgi:hypothetical protein